MTIRIATCSCGQLSTRCEGEPAGVTVCHCSWCQRRTGSVFGVGVYFPEAQVTVIGEAKVYARPAPGGRAIVNRFCPQCGTSLFWTGESFPGVMGVALGAFAEATFGNPVRSIWTKHRHGWFHLNPGIATHAEAAPLALQDE